MRDTHPDEGALRAHLDGELPWHASVACARHLRRCPSCGAALAGLAALDARATRLLAHARAAGALPAPARRARRHRAPGRRTLGVAAASAAALLAVVLWGRPTAPTGGLAARDVCCWDLDGGGAGDDGVFTVSRRGQVVQCVVLYDDVDRSGSYTRGDLVRSARGPAPCTPEHVPPAAPLPAS